MQHVPEDLVATVVLLGATMLLAAFGTMFLLVGRELRRAPRSHWQRITGWWGPWSPVRSQHVHYVVDGLEHRILDLSTIRLPKRGPVPVLVDPTRPHVALIDTGGTPGLVPTTFGILFLVLAGLAFVLAFAIPIGVALLRASLVP